MQRGLSGLIPILLAAPVLLFGCTAAQHKASVQDETSDRLTVGVVQKEVRIGMSGADVATVLGSPNVVSTDAERREVWIYDKIATDRVYSNSTAGVLGFIFGGDGGGAGGGAVDTGADSTSQRTLTVIIKFDDDRRVRDFQYHASRF